MLKKQSKKDGKDHGTIQSNTTPDPGYHMGKKQKYNKHHQQQPRGQPFHFLLSSQSLYLSC